MKTVAEMKKENQHSYQESLVKLAERNFEQRVAQAMREGKRCVTYYAYTVYFNWPGVNSCPWESELEEFINRVKKAGYQITHRNGDHLYIRW